MYLCMKMKDPIEELIKIASEIAEKRGMPSLFLADWDLPKYTTKKVKKKIYSSASTVNTFCNDWAFRITKIARELQR